MEDFLSNLSPALVWFFIGLILLLGEMIIPGLVVFFFGVGAWLVAIILVFLDISLNMQLLIFLISSVGLLFLLRNKFQPLFHGLVPKLDGESSSTDEFKGETGTVVETIKPGKPGKIEFRGTHWNAESNEEIAQGTRVEVVELKNLTLIVKTK